VNWSGVVALGYELNEDHEFGFNFIYNRAARTSRGGRWARPENLGDRVVDRSMLHWTERDLRNFQMLGRHDFRTGSDMHVDWLVSLAGTSQDEPDQRFFNYAREPDFHRERGQQQRAARAVGADAEWPAVGGVEPERPL
jgi:hypothetical protein